MCLFPLLSLSPICLTATISPWIICVSLFFLLLTRPPSIPLRSALLEEKREQEIANRSTTADQGDPKKFRSPTAEGEENVQETEASMEVIDTSHVKERQTETLVDTLERALSVGFVTLNDLCVKDHEYLKEKFRISPQTMLTIAIFYSLPLIQLFLQSQLNMDSSSNEDLCYFNSLCTRQFVILTALKNIFSNLGHCALGLLFLIIVYPRDVAYARFLTRYPAIGEEYGICQHFGLFMEGLISGWSVHSSLLIPPLGDHICPSKGELSLR